MIADRTRELAELDAFLARAATDGAALCLVGDPGAGKTTLLDATADRARGLGMRVHRAAGALLEADLPGAVLHQLLYPHTGDLTSYLRPPALVVVDDLHWADEQSREVLARLDERGIGLLAAGLDPPLGAMEVLEIESLDRAVAAAMVGSRSRGELGNRVLAATRGNPLAIIELGTVIEADRRLGRLGPAIPTLPLGRLQRSYVWKLDSLPGPARRALLMAALNDGPDLDLPGLDDDLDPAVRARILVADPATGRLRFRHALLRAAVVGASTTQERAQAHRDLAARHAGSPGRRAWHLAAVSLRPDATVAGLLDDVARQALAEGQGVTAVTALLRAADLSTDAAARSRRLAQAASVGAGVNGDLRGARELLDAAQAATPDAGRSLPVAVAAAQLLVDTDGDVDTAHRLLCASLEDAAFTPGDPALLDAVFELSEICRLGARPELWPPLDRALARLRPDVPAVLRLRVDSVRGPAAVTDADLALMDELIDAFAAESDPHRINWILGSAMMLGRGPELHPALRRVIEQGPVRSSIAALTAIALDLFAAGDWDGATAAGEEAGRLCEERGYAAIGRLSRVAPLHVAAGRGDHAAVLRETGALIAWAAPRGLGSLLFWCYHLQATAALGRGDHEEAYRQFSAICPPGTQPPTVVTARAAFDVVEAALRTGRTDQAVVQVRALEQAHTGRVTPWVALRMTAARAMIAPDDRAFALFDEALALPAAGHYPWDSARIRLAFGERLRRARQSLRSREQLAAALATFERLRAAPWAERAARELDAAAARRNGPAAHRLTPREQGVADLAAGGLTNRQIAARLQVSIGTVGAHLRQAYRKLGVASRGGLRDALDHHG
ncbi:LuxR C-terminal-related transcriptional regulator [Actinoplanes solisilvae]|uniref:LuxR C-terminal-related transcriptional regulator n=1 Tax=Actinoplanes solisilvae TaxID=2486853 RepID=UPI000FDB3912|nr:LuxR C-terminal-related transcriptional regulator [Actinoplanes solisilvae]